MERELDEVFFAGAVLMDISNAFDCVPYDLLIAELRTVLTESPSHFLILI